jgi:hypothetical protein
MVLGKGDMQIRNADILADRPLRHLLSTINTFVRQQARPRASANEVPFGQNRKRIDERMAVD